MRHFQSSNHPPALETPCIVTDLLDDIERHLSGAQGLDEAGIHAIRKDCKRLRALLRLLRPALSKTDFRRSDHLVRKYGGQLAHARDRTVLLHTLDRLDGHYGSLLTENALEPIRHFLQTDGTQGTAATALPDAAAMAIGLAQLRECFATVDFSHITCDTLVAGLLASYRHGRKSLGGLERVPDDEPAHVLRRHAKFLYIQLTLLSDWNPEGLKPVLRDFHTLEDTLGLVHDLTVLIETIREARPPAIESLHRELLLSLAETRWLNLFTDSMRLARRLYSRKPKKELAWLNRQLGTNNP